MSGDLTDPGGIAKFRRCLTAKDPLNEIRRDNNIAAPANSPNAPPGEAFGRDTRFHVADGIERFQVVDGKLVYVINGAAKLWRATMDGKDARLVDERVADFVLTDRHLFIRGTDGALWRVTLDGSERTRIDQSVAAFQPINAAVIYVLGIDHTLWREIGDASKRTEVDHTVKDFQAIDVNLVFRARRRRAAVARNRQRGLACAGHQRHRRLPILSGRRHRLCAGRRRGVVAQERQRQARAGRPGSSGVPGDGPSDGVCARQDGRLWREMGGRAQEAALVDRDVLVTAGKAAFHADDPAHVMVLGSDHKLWAESTP